MTFYRPLAPCAKKVQIVGVGLGFAVIPKPPERALGKLEPGGLVLVVLDQVLVDVSHDHRQAIISLHLREGQAEQTLGVDRKPRPVAVEKILHLTVVHIRLDENAVDQGVDIVGVRFRGIEWLLPFGILKTARSAVTDTV